MLDSNNKFRLQILNHEEVFETRDKALGYITDFLKPDVLFAEPAIVLYGDKDAPNVILAIGSGERKVFTIDLARLEEDLENIKEDSENSVEEIAKASKTIKSIIKACGLTLNENKIEDQVEYIHNSKDVIIGDAKTLAEAIELLSEYVQKVSDNSKFNVVDTNSIKLIFKADEEGDKVLKAKVKISTDGYDDSVDFNNNMIGVKSDGLYAATSLDYEEHTNTLIYTTSGMKDGVFKNDAIRKEIPLGKHTEIEGSAYNSNPIEIKVKDNGDKKTVEGYLKLSENEQNIIKIQDGKLTAKVTLWYDKSSNELVFNNGTENKRIPLNVGGLIEEARYDKTTESIILKFKTTNGGTTTLTFSVKDLIEEWVVSSNTEGAIELSKERSVDGQDVLSAKVRINNTHDDNILVNDNGTLYVKGVSENIKHGDTTVAEALENVKTDNAKTVQDLIGEINQRTAQANEILSKLEQEVLDRKNADNAIVEAYEHADEDIKHLIEDLKIDDLKQLVDDFQKEYGDFVNTWTEKKTEIEGILNQAKEVIDKTEGRVKTLEDGLNAEILRATNAEKTLQSDLTTEVERVNGLTDKVNTLESKVDTHITNYDKLNDSVTNLTNEVGNVKTDVESLKASVNTNTSNVAANLDKISNEISRATQKETEIEGKLNDEVNRATGEETRLETLINTNKEGIASNKTNIDGLISSAAVLRNELDNEVTRAKGEEKRIEDKVDALTVSSKEASDNALEQAKKYTDTEILKVTSVAADDATNKANKAFDDAKLYSDDKLALETARAQAAEETNANAIKELKAKDEVIEANVAKKIENVRIEKNSQSDLQYVLYVDNVPVSEINIPEDQFLENARYDVGSKSIIFTWKIGDEHPETSVDVSDFITFYYAGNGLQESNNVFSVKLTTANESYLQVTEDGIQLVGIEAKFDTKADKNNVYTKLEVDNAVEAEYIRAKSEENSLNDQLNTVKSDASALAERVSANETALGIINGNSAQEGSIAKALSDAIAHADELNRVEVERAKLAEKAAEDNAKAYTDAVKSELQAGIEATTYKAGDGLQSSTDNTFSVKIKEGEQYLEVASEGIRTKGIDDAISTAVNGEATARETAISELTATVNEKANVSDVYNTTDVDSKVQYVQNQIDILNSDSEQPGSVDYKVRKAVETLNSKDDEIEGKISDEKQRAENAETSLADKINSIGIEPASENDKLTYYLKVGGEIVSTISIPEDKFYQLTKAEYIQNQKSIRFTFNTTNGETTFDVNVADLVDTYTNGNGLNLNGNEFSIIISPASEGYLTVGEDGLKLIGINEALATKVDVNKFEELEGKLTSQNDNLTSLIDGAKQYAKELVDKEAEIRSTADITITTELGKKANQSEVYSKDVIEGKLSDTLNSANLYTNTEVAKEKDRAVGAEQAIKEESKNYTDTLASKVYTIEQSDYNFATKTDLSDVQGQLNQTKTDILLKANASDLTKTNEEVAKKANSSDVYDKNYTNETFVTKLDAETTYAKTADVYLSAVVDEKFFTKSEALKLISSENANDRFLSKTDAKDIYATLVQNKDVSDIANKNKEDIASLKNEVDNVKFTVANTNTVTLVNDDKVLKADIRLNNDEGNAIRINDNGIFVNYTLSYNSAENTLAFTDGKTTNTIKLTGASIVTKGHYESSTKEIILELENGGDIKIPVTDLFNQLTPINPDNDPINIVIDNDANTIQANVNFSQDEDNLLLEGNGTLYASKAAEKHSIILHGVKSNLSEVVNGLDTNVTNIQTEINNIKSDLETTSNDISDLKQKVNANTSDITDIQSRLEPLEKDNEKNKENITLLESRLATAEQTIVNLQTIINGDGSGSSITERLNAVEEAINELIDFGTYHV